MKKHYHFCFLLFLFLFSQIFINIKILAQTNDTTKIEDLLRFKVSDMNNQTEEDLLNVQVSLASKKLESLFDAPVSTSVLTREEIKRSGATSIPEALRLIPGMMIWEQSNGNYDVHMRGGSNVQRNSLYSVGTNTKTLVMIDNRPVYNYYLGGTFWETLAVDLGDIERIEVVRGAASAMYGPNAVSGVINIITKRLEETGGHTNVNVQQGSNNTYINNASIGYRFNRKLSFTLSGNSQIRDRKEEGYYSYGLDRKAPINEIILYEVQQNNNPNGIDAYPRPSNAMIKAGGNIFLEYKFNDKSGLYVSAGMQDSQVQKVYSENLVTPLTSALSNSKYWDARLVLNRLTIQNSQQWGKQEEGLGLLGQKWDFRTSDLTVEYDLKKIFGVNFKATYNARNAVYDDTPYVDVAKKTGQFNGVGELNTQSISLRGDYSTWEDKLRLSGAMRLDKFNVPDDFYLSYLFSVNYKKNEQNNARFSYQRAYRSPNIIFSYANRYISNLFGVGAGSNVDLEIVGNKSLKLLQSDVFEVGYRTRFSTNMLLDIEVFADFTKNYSDFLYIKPYQKIENGLPVTVQPFQSQNIPLETRQFGTTISLFYLVKKIQIRPYITIQNTTLLNSSTFNNTAEALFAGINVNPTQNNINSSLGNLETHTGMPTVFGGVYGNLQYDRFNFNLNCYFFSTSKYYSFQNGNFQDSRGIDNITGKVIANIKITYSPITSTSVFLNIRNVLNQNQNEFFRSDQTTNSVYGGLHFDF